MTTPRGGRCLALGALLVAALLQPACDEAPATTSGAGAGGTSVGGAKPALHDEAAFVDVPPRQVAVHGEASDLAATARMFVNYRRADTSPEDAPILVAFNGFGTAIVQSFGMGPTTVAEGGDVVPNPASLTRFANLLFVDPRQSGYSYDVIEGRAPEVTDCSRGVFNEYTDAGDVLHAVLLFLEAHPQLHGPVIWVGESYAGVRIQWILAMLRDRWDLLPYVDDQLAAAISRAAHPTSLAGGQVLLQPWLLGKAHGDAIGQACLDPAVAEAVSLSVASPCGTDACLCADSFQRSRYDYDLTLEQQATRVREAVQAHVTAARFESLLGVPVTSVVGLAAADRRLGFKCDVADATIPAEDELVAALGALQDGQRYYLPYNALQPGKEIDPFSPDWKIKNYAGDAFIDNLRSVRTLVTDGPLDLVVPTRALAPGLAALIGADKIDASSPVRIGVITADGERAIDLRAYPSAGHMITMFAADAFATDLEAWLAE